MFGQTMTAATVSMVMFSACPAWASITFDLLPVDNSAVLTGYTTYDMQVTTDTDWTAAAGLLELTAGSIYQHANGTDNEVPHPFLVSLFPELAFDTYVVGSTAGGAGDVGGDGYAFGTDELDVSWFDIAKTDIGTTTIGRLTLTDDTAGNLSIMLTAEGEVAEFDVTISPGVLPLMSQVIREVAEPIGGPSVDRSPHEWLLADGTKIWLIGDGPEGATRILNSYEQFDLLREQGLLTSPSFDRRRVLRDRLRSPVYSWSNRFEPPPAQPDPDPVAELPEPGALILLGTCVGTAMMRRRRR